MIDYKGTSGNSLQFLVAENLLELLVLDHGHHCVVEYKLTDLIFKVFGKDFSGNCFSDSNSSFDQFNGSLSILAFLSSGVISHFLALN